MSPETPAPDHLETERLRLRRWTEADRDPFAALNADPEVMAHFPSTLSRAESDALVDRIIVGFEVERHGLWAAEVRSTGTFIGFVGLYPARFDEPFCPAVEVGWRLAQHAWSQGYAIEAARASVADGFERLDLPEIVSFTSVGNVRSRAVMERLGMVHDPADDFDHPSIPPGHPLARHVLYRLAR